MLIGDSSSSQNTQRQRRHAAENRALADTSARDIAVREGVAREVGARQAGEAPQRVEVDRFRALMQGGRNAEPRASAKDSRTGVQGAPQAAHEEPAALIPVGSHGVAEQFRAAMRRAFGAQDGAKGEAPKDDKPVPGKSLPQVVDATDWQCDARPAQERRACGADDPARRAAVGMRADAEPKALGKDGAAARSSGATDEGSDAKPAQADKGDAQSAQQLARKAEQGETQAAQATRTAHSSGKDDSLDGKDALTAQLPGTAAPAMMPAESMAPMPQQSQAPAMAQAPQAAAGGFAPALSELIQKHVRQMLVTDPRSARGRSREVLLRMHNDAMPGTDLWLTRTDDGWRLRAEVSSRDAYDLLLEHQGDLVRRFADSHLGELSIEPVFHDNSGADHAPLRSHASITRNG